MNAAPISPRASARSHVLGRLAGTLQCMPKTFVDALAGDREALFDLLVDAYITGRIDAADEMRTMLREQPQ